MKKSMLLASILMLGLLISLPVTSWAIEWHAWGVHDGSTTVNGDQVTFTAPLGVSAYTWSNDTQYGVKTFYTTSEFNGKKVSDLYSYQWDYISGGGNPYVNIFVEDSNGKKAIIGADGIKPGVPNILSTYSTWCVYEGQSGFALADKNGGAAGYYTFADIKDFTITTGVYEGMVNPQGGWDVWDTANNYSTDGFAFLYGNRGGTYGPSPIVASNLSVTPTPLPGTLLLLGSGLTGLVLWRRRQVAAKS